MRHLGGLFVAKQHTFIVTDRRAHIFTLKKTTTSEIHTYTQKTQMQLQTQIEYTHNPGNRNTTSLREKPWMQNHYHRADSPFFKL